MNVNVNVNVNANRGYEIRHASHDPGAMAVLTVQQLGPPRPELLRLHSNFQLPLLEGTVPQSWSLLQNRGRDINMDRSIESYSAPDIV